MEIVWTILSVLLVLLGLVGAIVPILPGPILSFLGLATLLLVPIDEISTSSLWLWGLVAVAITALDYVIPIWGTKKFGGSKFGVRGSLLGLVVGLFFPPFGIILGPFLGALVGEMLYQKNSNQAFRSALGSFGGFLVGTGLKLFYGAFAAFYVIKFVIGHASASV